MLLTGTAHPTLAHVLRRRALDTPEKIAFRYLDASESAEALLTYGGLDRRARAIAARLEAAGAANEPVCLLYQPGLDFITAFLGCLYAGAAAVPAYPPSGARGQGLSRLRAILDDCGARTVLTHAALSADAAAWKAAAPELASRDWMLTDPIAEDEGPGFHRELDRDLDRIAFLQYTSGSTASPRGAVVTHGNLMHNLACIRDAFAGDPDRDRGVFWLPQYHDMGLTGGLLLTCWGGTESTVLSPLAFVKRPLLWLRAISRTRATISGGPNFAYDLCLKRITDADLADLDLSSWRIAFSGAENVDARTCLEFARRFASCGFRPDAFQPGYGMAEATLIVTSRPPSSPLASLALEASALEEGRARPLDAGEGARRRTVVSCGAPVPGQEVRIVDAGSCRELPPLEVGEIWVRSASVARGYWKRSEESEHTFGGRLVTGEGPFLRTGDLGFLHQDELYVTGRLKELLIFNGKNHYPLDIEQTVRDTDREVSLAVAVSVPGDSGERLVLVCQTRRRGEAAKRATAIREAVAREHGLEVHDLLFVGPGEIPRTSSGKVQRRAVAGRYLAGEIVRLFEGEKTATKSALTALLVSEIATKCEIPESEVDIHAPFVTYGLGSVDAVRITGRLEELLSRTLSPTLAYEYPTIDKLARYLADGEEETRSDARPIAKREVQEGIAMVGMACRFPGAPDLASFEKLLRTGGDAVGPMPGGRTIGPGASPVAGYLDEVDRFAAEHFGIDDAEAAAMDPQQRILLELAYQALEDAGHPSASLAGSATGVWIGISSADYALERFGDPNAHPHSHAAQAHSIAANRISYQFDLQGPSIAVDTACSSSLVAVHLACRALWSGECSLALAGGVNVLLASILTEQFQRGGYMSRSGRCRAFDAGADGYVRGEGAAVVVLKPLARAIADRDRIYAVVRGTAVNQDGRTNGITAPSRQAQEAVLRRAYSAAGVDPPAVSVIEAHGTGTPLGDPIEARALGAVLGRGRESSNPCRIGSVKTNIGHLEAAAGIAGLVKTALSLYTRTLYPSLHFRERNPNIDLDELGLSVQTECEPWPGSERIAGVSSFGFGGTNAHAVLGEAGARPTLSALPPHPQRFSLRGSPEEGEIQPWLLPISAPTGPAVRAHANALADALASGTAGLPDVSYTEAVRRTHHRVRLTAMARTREDMVRRLRDLSRGSANALESPRGDARIAFVFGGQGGQWLGMGRDLSSRHPVFRAVLEQVEEAVAREAGWSLLESLKAPEPYRQLERVQPMLFAVGVATSHLLRSWGLSPDVMMGQSMGEITAAAAAGVLTIEEGARAIVRRSALLAKLSGTGAMAMVDLPAARAHERLRGLGVTVAVHASPTSSVIAGEEEAVRAATELLTREDVGVRAIQVDVASHSPLVEPLQEEILQALSSVRGRNGKTALLSSVTGRSLRGDEIDASYLWRNLREPVRFAEMVGEALSSGIRCFVEIGPHPILTASIAQSLGTRKVEDGIVLGTLERDRDGSEALLETAAALYERGFDLDWAAVLAGASTAAVADVPQPALPRRRHWTEPPSRKSSPRETEHPLLDFEVRSPALGDRRVFELSLSAAAHPELTHHRIAGAPIVSAGAFLEIALAAIQRSAIQRGTPAGTEVVLENIVFERFLQVPSSGARPVQVIVEESPQPERSAPGARARSERAQMEEASRGARAMGVGVGPHRMDLKSFSIQSGGDSWTRHVSGTYQVRPPAEEFPALLPTPERILPKAELYAALEEKGLSYGPPCRRLAEVRLGEGASEVRLEELEGRGEGYLFHPHALDMCLQSIAPLAKTEGLLARIRALRLRARRPEGSLVAQATSDGGSFSVRIADSLATVATVEGIELAAPARPLREPPAWRKRIEWSPVSSSEREPSGRFALVGPQSPLRDALAKSAPAEAVLFDDGQSLTSVEGLSGIVLLASSRTTMADFLRVSRCAGPTRPLWLITRGALSVLAGDALVPMQAALSAAARTAWAEGAFDGAALDLDPRKTESPEEESRHLWIEIGGGPRQHLAAWRRGRRHEPRLERAFEPRLDARLPVDSEATYLVTGGLSDLGLHASTWLLGRGARRLVLCGRSKEASQHVAKLAAEGASITFRSVDVSDPRSVFALAEELGPVAGIVHAAGAVTPSPFHELTDERFEEAFRPKVDGARNLWNAFGGPQLRFFLLYGSSSAWLGALGRGLVPYAAANAYLEAFAIELERAGTRATTIAWPPWQDIGRVRDAAAAGHFDALGVSTIAPEEAAEILDRLDRGSTLLCSLDSHRYSRYGADAQLLASLEERSRPSTFRAVAAYQPPADRLEEKLARSWEEVLQVPRVGRNDSFFLLGGSSLKAATLLNRLRRHMSEPISIVALFEAPTIAHLASYLREHHPDCAAAIEADAPSPAETTIDKIETPTDLLARIDELSDEEVESLLVEQGHVDAR
jgi:acyl transferase domain-containing protein/acyl-CoA synthetase (AMP-forming)/AMP-acid ligase II/acyl carrier protein